MSTFERQMPEGPSKPPVPLPTWAAIPCPRCTCRKGGETRPTCAICNGRGAVRVNLDDLPILEPVRS